MDKAEVVYSGILKKSPPERRLMRTWHKRYFVLKSNKTLAYFPSEKDKKPVKEPIDLTNCQSIEANLNHNNKNFKHVFSINTTKRVYYLVADTKADMDNWVKHLCRVCGFEKQGSPDFMLNRPTKSSPKAIKKTQTDQTATLPSPVSPSPQPLCPLSQSMPVLHRNKPRSISDPADHHDMMKRAEQNYLASTLDRRKSTEVTPHCERPNHTLPVKSPELGQVQECYDIVPPPHLSNHEVDGGYASLRQQGGRTPVDSSKSLLSNPTENYDVVPRPRPVSQDMYDVVPPPRPSSRCTEDDIYDIPPNRDTEQGNTNYDIVPPPKPSVQNGQVYDYVPKHNRYSYNPEDEYDIPPMREAYDTVPPPRPKKNTNNSDYYDTLPPPTSPDDLYDIPPTFHNENTSNIQPPARPPKPSAATSVKDHYDIVPAPGRRTSRQESLEYRDSGSYPDDIYSVPPPRTLAESDNDIYDTPPKLSGADIYDELPRHNSFEEDYYDTPPVLSEQGFNVAPSVDRSIKPPPVNRNTKPPDHNYTNLAPPVDRKCKPPQLNRPETHGYENLIAPETNSRGQLLKSHSLPETETSALLRNHQQTDYCDMQPYRSEDTRCYSFSRDMKEPTVNYEDMDGQVHTFKRESGVHSNTSSSEDGDTEDCYMTMGPPEQSQRKAALQYCEVQIIDGQAKCQPPAPRRNAESHYTTINEESTQAFLQTCRQQETSRN